MTSFYTDLFQPRRKGMRVLVACEYSGIVRNAFLARGHDAWSCDLLPSDDGSNRHIRGDAREILNDGWDLLMVAHPPCTRLCNSGVRCPSCSFGNQRLLAVSLSAERQRWATPRLEGNLTAKEL